MSRMGELRNRSIRVDDDVWAAIQALPGRTQNEALRAALFGNGSDIDGKISEILELSRSMAGTIEGAILNAGAQVTREIMETTAHPLTDNRPKNCFCKHCSNRFAGPRFASICSNCKSGGHTNQPSECPLCNEGSSI